MGYYSFRIGGDRIDTYFINTNDRVLSVVAREHFIPSLAVLQEVLTNGDEEERVGGFIMSRWLKPRKQGGSGRKIWVPYDSIFSIIRALHHGVEGYERDRSGSLPVIRSAIQQSVDVQAALMGLRTVNLKRRLPIVIEEVNKMLSGLSLGRGDREICRAVVQATQVKSGKDTLGRVNAYALLSKLLSARRKFMGVEAGLVTKNAEFHRRRSVLLSTLGILEYAVGCAKETCSQLIGQRGEIEHSEEMRIYACEILLSFSMLFDSIDIKPYVATFQYAANEFRRVAHLFDEGYFDDAYAILATSEASFDLRCVRTDLERTLFHISRIVHLHRGKNPPTPLKGDVARLDAAIEAITGLDTSEMRDFDALAITKRLQSVRRAYRHRLYLDAHDQLKQVCSLI